MYRRHYGLAEEPFSLTPDPRFLLLTPSHAEALAAVLYGIRARRGFVALTGEVGTGKTTLLRHAMSQTDDAVTAAYIFNTDVTFDDLLWTVMKEWEIPPCEGRAQMLQAIYTFLIAQLAAGKITALVIDEAQNLSVPMLEQLRMLSNLETTREKLLQIVLAGQPELENKLNRPELRQLKQRISLVSTLKPLTRKEADEYITRRLQVAGYQGPGVFTRRALHRIWRASRGIPRRINIICENALIVGYGEEKRRIGASIVNDVVDDLDGRKRTWKATPRVAVAAGALLVAGVAAYGAHQVARSGGVALGVTSSTTGGPAPAAQPVARAVAAEAPASPPDRAVRPEPAPMPTTDTGPEREGMGTASPPVVVASAPWPSATRIAVVKTRQALSAIAAEAYGHASPTVLDLVRSANPQITDVNVIHPSQQIALPDVDLAGRIHRAADGGYLVHLVTVQTERAAREFGRQLSKSGHKVHTIPVNVSDDTVWYRIVVGHFATEEAAREIGHAAEKQLNLRR